MFAPTCRDTRSIPAYAGEPSHDGGGSARHLVYPRVCGGTSATDPAPALRTGLSPRMRGNPLPAGRWATVVRSIPAYAGEPTGWPRRLRQLEVYPRVCGGTLHQPVRVPYPCGLSPRMRGNPASGHPDRSAGRSIPAYAGEPLIQLPVAADKGVYPRVCGGTFTWKQNALIRWGLSPRMRGNLGGRLLRFGGAGSIPAYAGEPGLGDAMLGYLEVYPRVCGGTHGRKSQHTRQRGLSPRMRGNPSGAARTIAASGSIPAYAGEPASIRRRMRCQTVYPRVCGGTTIRAVWLEMPAGLSPRMRGNPIAY